MRFFPAISALLVIAVACSCVVAIDVVSDVNVAAAAGFTSLSGHVPSVQVGKAIHLGRLSGETQVPLVVALNLKDPAGLNQMVKRLYDPSDSLYHKFLTPAQFADAYAPSDIEIAQVTRFLASKGLTVKRVHDNRLFVSVSGQASDIESAFNLELHQYISDEGQIAYAPTSEPSVPSEVAAQFSSIVGLDNFSVRKPNLTRPRKQGSSSSHPPVGSIGTGTDNSGLDPADIASVYSLPTVANPGNGQTIGLLEYDGYTASDITAYETAYSLHNATITPVSIDGESTTPGVNADEVTLDIELVLALASHATIKVYEASINGDAPTIDMMSKIATDNPAMISCSWGLQEIYTTASLLTSENTILTEMVAQGESFFSATGDSGAYGGAIYGDLGLAVVDPSTQYYAIAVGGTTLSVDPNTVTYKSETTWFDTDFTPNTGSGGGNSVVTAPPPWQVGLGNFLNHGLLNHGITAARMVPDVSLNADPYSGYSIYFDGAWTTFGGTSASTPLWAAYSALINQTRLAAAETSLGFLAPVLYATGASSIYNTVFNDIADGSTNGFYNAVTGYDLTTGWGTFQGTNLYNALVAAVIPPAAPSAMTVASTTLSSVTPTWAAVGNATTYDLWESASASGPFTDVCPSVASPAVSCVVNGLSTGVTYYFYVTATNSAATSGWSSIVTGTPVLIPPSAPTGLTATAIN